MKKPSNLASARYSNDSPFTFREVARKKKRSIILDVPRQPKVPFRSTRPPIRFSLFWKIFMRMKDYANVECLFKSIFWILDHGQLNHGWLLSIVDTISKDHIVVLTSTNQTITIPFQSNDFSFKMFDESHSNFALADTSLWEFEHLNEAFINYRIHHRYQQRQYCTWLSPHIVCAVNSISQWPEQSISDMAAHFKGRDCSICLNGISGSGKSRLSRQISLHLLSSELISFKFAVLETLASAFLSASTLRNANSSCFCKELVFHYDGDSVNNIQLKVRCFQSQRVCAALSGNERNFHVFYQLCNGWKSHSGLKQLQVKSLNSYRMLGDDVMDFRTVTDADAAIYSQTNKRAFQKTKQALEVIGLSELAQEDLWRILAALLLLGNIDFVEATVSTETVLQLQEASNLLDIDIEIMEETLLRSSSNASQNRDLLVEHIYRALVRFVFHAANNLFSSFKSNHQVRIFENPGPSFFFPKEEHRFNCSYGLMHVCILEQLDQISQLSLESLLQNYQNAKLLQMTMEVLHGDQAQNQGTPHQVPCISVYGGQANCIFELLDEYSVANGAPEEFVTCLNAAHKCNSAYVQATFGYVSFRIMHWEGEFVDYDVKELFRKNKMVRAFDSIYDPSNSTILGLLRNHKNDPYRSNSSNDTTSMAFRNEIGDITKQLDSSEQFFIWCIQPNSNFENVWSHLEVLFQLRYLGVQDLERCRDESFSIRKTATQIEDLYFSIARYLNPNVQKDAILETIFGKEEKYFRMQGDHVLFSKLGYQIIQNCRWAIREKSCAILQRESYLLRDRIYSARIIQRFLFDVLLDKWTLKKTCFKIINAVRSFRVRWDFLAVKKAVIRIQSLIRSFLSRCWHARACREIIQIQKIARGYRTKCRFKMILMCRTQFQEFLLPCQIVVRASFVQQVVFDAGLGSPSKSKRIMLLVDGGSHPEIMYICPIEKKLEWSMAWTAFTASNALTSGSISYFELQGEIKNSPRILGFFDVVAWENNNKWAHDINEACAYPLYELLNCNWLTFTNRFKAALCPYGIVHLERGSKDMVMFLHQNKICWIKGAAVKGPIVIDSTCVVRAAESHTYAIEIGSDQVKTHFSMHSRLERDKWMMCITTSMRMQADASSNRSRRSTLFHNAMAVKELNGSFKSFRNMNEKISRPFSHETRIRPGLYFEMSTVNYIIHHSSRSFHDSERLRTRKAVKAKLRVGHDALPTLLSSTQFSNCLSFLIPEKQPQLDLLMISGHNKPIAADAVLWELLKNLKLGHFQTSFEAQECTAISQAKHLTRQDLRDMGVLSLQHQQKMLDAFQRFKVRGGANRNSMTLIRFYRENSDFFNSLKSLNGDLEQHIACFLDNNCTSIEKLEKLSRHDLKRMGFSHTECKRIAQQLRNEIKLDMKVRFTDQVDWFCNVCSQNNVGANISCRICGRGKPEMQSGNHISLERAIHLDNYNPWTCKMCWNTNASSIFQCAICRLRKDRNDDTIIATSVNRDDRVMLNAVGLESTPIGSVGTVIKVLNARECDVRFDNGTIAVVDIQWVKKATLPARISNFMVGALLSPSSIAREFFGK